MVCCFGNPNAVRAAGTFEVGQKTFLLDGIKQKDGTADITRKSTGRSWTVPKE